MKLLISNYFEAIGGIPLIQNLKSHSLWCSVEAKGIQQTWKESYNYESGEFQVVVENEGVPIMVTEGNKIEAVRKVNKQEQKLGSDELAILHTTIILVPEILFLEEEYIRSISDVSLTILDDENILKFKRHPYFYTYIFSISDGLKKEVRLSDVSDSAISLTIRYSDWRDVNGLLYPFVQDMVNERMESRRRVIIVNSG